jgi:sorbitol/mannitol transport system substrate-binding protein
MSARDQLQERQELIIAATHGRLTRREVMKRGAALGLSASAIAMLLGSRPHAAAAPTGHVTSWAPAGQRWEFPQRAVYPLFQKKFPDITVDWVVEPISDMLPKTAIAMAAKEDRYDIIHEDYNFVPQLISMNALEPIEHYLDQDPAFKADILADVPENVMDLYRDKPAAQGGQLYGLPPDSNCQLQYYRADELEKAGIKEPAKTWDDALQIAKELSNNGQHNVTGTTLKAGGVWPGGVFITLLRSYGGDWFDKMEPGGWNPQLNTAEGHLALTMLRDLSQYLEPGSYNAADDEANTAMANGAWVYAPVQWGGTTMNDPAFTKFADVWKTTVVPMGAGPKARNAPHMGGLGMIIPVFSKNKDAAWEFVKFCNYGDKQDPAVGKAWVEGTGQPARASLLTEYGNLRAHFAALQASLPHAMRYLPIPESNALYTTLAPDVTAAAHGDKDIDAALKDMDATVKKIMSDAGYYNK